jgi:pyrroline-5-carboxylate reductase
MENSTILSPNLKLGLIGAGNMARAIVKGILKSHLCRPSHIYISHPSANQHKKFTAEFGIENETASNEFVVRNSDIILICVKPQRLEVACKSFRDCLELDRHLVISIVAGVSLEKLTQLLLGNEHAQVETSNLRLAKCTVNLAAELGLSASAFSQNGNLTTDDKEYVVDLLSSIGICAGELKDSDMAASLAIAGSSIAYMYIMVDAMADGGVKMGLTRDMALKLSIQTMKGASAIMQQELGHKHPAQLKDEVCSPGGTTIAGLHELERNGFRNSIISAIEAATNRAKQF